MFPSPPVLRAVLAWAFAAALGAAAWPSSATAAEPPPRITLGPQVQVSADLPDRPHVEPFIAADPRDPDHLVAGSIAFTRQDEQFTCTAFASHDGGKTWRRAPLSGLDEARLASDPWVAFDGAGRVYLSCLREKAGRDEPVVFRSEDGGRSWQPPAVVPLGKGGSFDHPVLAADASGGPRGGALYLTGIQGQGSRNIPFLISLGLSRSTDQGHSFSEPHILWPSSLNLNLGGAAVLSDGTLVVVYFDFQSLHGWLRKPRLWALRFPSGEPAPLPPYFVTEEGGGFFPSLAVGPPGPLADQLFLAWTRVPQNPESIQLSVSGNGGETWSAPIQVDDAPDSATRVVPAMAVSSRGMVGVAWWDSRNHEGTACWDIYFAASADGGRSFSPSVRVTPETFCPDTPGNLVHSRQGSGIFPVARRWRFGGDYMGLAAAADGRFHLMWADSRTGVYQIWTTAVEVTPGEAAESEPSSATGTGATETEEKEPEP